MTFPITAIYAAILCLWMIVLQIAVVAARGRTEVLFGDGGRMDLLLPMRRHANFIETVPMALILLALAEAQGLSAGWLHGAGLRRSAPRAGPQDRRDRRNLDRDADSDCRPSARRLRGVRLASPCRETQTQPRKRRPSCNIWR